MIGWKHLLACASLLGLTPAMPAAAQSYRVHVYHGGSYARNRTLHSSRAANRAVMKRLQARRLAERRQQARAAARRARSR